MSDLILAVRITADGAQLVGQLSAAEIKALGTRKALNDAAAGGDQFARSADGAARSADRLAHSQDGIGASAARAGRDVKAASTAIESAIARQRAGYQQLGFQVGDFFTQIAGGTSVFVAFAQQSGQAAGALQLLGSGATGTASRFSSFAKVLSGPWGIAISAGLPLVALLAQHLFEVDEASKAAENASRALASSQSQLADYIDISTGKIREQITALQILGQVRAQQATIDEVRASLRKDAVELAGLTSAPFVRRSALGLRIRDTRRLGLGFLYTGAPGQSEVASLNQRLQTDQSFTPEQYVAGIRSAARSNPELRRALPQIETVAIRVAEGRGDIRRGEALQRMVQGEGSDEDRQILGLPPERQARSRRRAGPSADTLARRAAAETQRLARFSEQSADAIGRINDRWNEQPRLIDQARQDTERLDHIIADLEKRKPPNFEATIAQANAAKAAIETGLLRPFNDLVTAGEERRAQQLLVLQGHEQEAEVLARVQQLRRQGVDVTETQRATIEAQVADEERINQLLAKRDAIIGPYLDSIAQLRGDLADLLSGGSVADFGRNLLANARRLRGQLLTEQLFGDGLRALQDRIRRETGLEGAVDLLARQTGEATQSLDTVGEAALRLADAFNRAGDRVVHPAAAVAASAVPAPTADDPENREILVTARRRPGGGAATITSMRPSDYFIELARVMTAPITDLLRQIDDTIGTRLAGRLGGVFEGAFAGYLQSGKVGAVLGGLDALVTGGPLDKLLGKASKGAGTGATIAQIGQAFGIKTSGTGGAIGGALGSLIPIPGLDIVGGIVGSLVGGLFSKKPYGTAVLTGTGSPTVTGNKADAKADAASLGGAVQNALETIAQQLGGELDSYLVSIGVDKGNFRVSPSGKTGKLKGGDVVDFGKDGQTAAIAYAISDAIADGGVKGLSAAVQRALKSSTDIDAAVKEALKVQEVEDLLGGLGAELVKQFRAFDTQAKERERIARQYGFDVVAIEKRNAEDRVKLVDQLLTDRVGSLQSLLKDLKTGSLFEGSAEDRRSALLADFEKARTDAAAGVDGAATNLADLARQLIETSREAFGTAGNEYSSDRSSAQTAAEQIIAIENDRIRAAQDAAIGTRDAVIEGNRLANETNDILAATLAQLREMSIGAPAFGGGINLELVARSVNLR